MGGLMYREDMDEVRARLTSWWNGEDIGRPALQLFVRRDKPIEPIEPMPPPPGWAETYYTTKSFDFRVNVAARWCINHHYLAEAVPNVSPDLAPNCLALYLGCQGIEQAGTVWCEPCIQSPETARFVYDPDNFYWNFSLRLGREMLRIGKNKFLVSFPDLIEGLDTLAAMRGNEQLLMDLHERPDWVHTCLRHITDKYFRYYDVLYDLFRDEVGGSIYWAWAPGRITKLQCDFSAMIGADMFAEFMIPLLKEMTERTSYSMYHLDGPDAIRHLDHLLDLPRLNMIQWVPGEGQEPPDHPKWWPLFHRILDAGKKVFLTPCRGIDELRALHREFREAIRGMMIQIEVPNLADARTVMDIAESA